MMLAMCTLAAPGVHANDLIVEQFTLSDITLGGVSLLGEDPIYYLQADNPPYMATFTVRVSWDCGSWVSDACTEARPDTSFDVTLQGVTSNDRLSPIVVPFPGANISYRNHGPSGTGTTGELLIFQVPITEPAFDQFVTGHFVSLDTLEVRGRMDPGSNVPEDLPDTVNNRALAPLNTFVALSGTLFAGPATATVSAFDSVDETPCNGAGSVTLFGTDFSYDPGAGFDTININGAPLCVNAGFNGTALDLIARDEIELGDISGTLGGLEIFLLDNSLLPDDDPSGGGVAPGALGLFTVALPSGVTFHAVDFYQKPLAAGLSDMLFLATSPAYASLDDLEGVSALGFLATEALPFSIRNDSATLNASGFAGEFDIIHYRFDMTFELSDTRNADQVGVVSNDARFIQPDALPSPLPYALTPGGLQINAVPFALRDDVRTHYPRTRLNVPGFGVQVVDNAIADGSSLPAIGYRFPLSGDCPECLSGEGNQAVDLDPTAEIMASDGSVTSLAPLNLNPVWGPLDANSGNRIYKRNGDIGTNGLYYFPGWVATGTDGSGGTRVADWLTGARQVQLVGGVPAPSTQFFAQDAASVKGNYFFAGLTMGPEVYANAAGVPVAGLGTDLSGTGSNTTIGLGGLSDPYFQSITSNIGTKYVLRAGGLTGVFNTDDMFTPLLYGYQVDVSRFAFRQISNAIDTENWFDGRVFVAGKGQFNMHFENLDLDCNGNLGAAWPVEEVCGDGIGLDLNCNEDFAAWNTKVDFQSMAFVPDNPFASACEVQDRELWVGNSMDFIALDEPLGIVGAWDTSGEVELISITGETDHVVDRPAAASGTDDQGFAVAFDADGDLGTPFGNNTDGYLKAGALVGVPLWDALDIDLRLANTALTSPAQSIVTGAGVDMTGDDANVTNDVLAGEMKQASNLTAKYTWGATSFGFNLPVYYDMDRYADGRHPRFIGKTLGTDLVVFEANAGVDFIHPDATKLSFGASADFEALALAEFDLNVDLSSPESIASVDGFLGTLGIAAAPVADLVGGMQGVVGELNGIFGAGFDGFVEAGLRTSLDALTADIEVATDAISLLQSVPEQFASIGVSAFEQLVVEMLAPLDANIEANLLDVYLTLPDLLVQADTGGVPVGATLAADLTAQRMLLSSGEDALDVVMGVIDDTQYQVDQAVLAFDALINAVVNVQAPEAIAALQALQALLPDPLPTGGACVDVDFGDLPPADGPAVFEQIYHLGVGLLDAQSALQVTNIVDFALTVAAVTGVDTELARSAQVIVDELSEEVDVQIDNALALVEGLCAQLPSADALADVNALLDDMIAAMQGIQSEVLTVRLAMTDPVSGIFVKLLDEMDGVRAQVAGVRQYLTDLKSITLEAELGFPNDHDFNALVAVEIQDAMNLYLLDVTNQQYSFHYPGTLFQAEQSFIAQMSLDLREPIDALIAQAGFLSQQPLNDLLVLLPHPSVDDMITVIVDLTMNAPIVAEVDLAINQALTEAVAGVNDIALDVFDQLNFVIKDIVQQLETAANAALSAATAVIPDMPISAAALDGYALVQGDELERLHIGAQWSMQGDEEENTSSYSAALDVTSWSAANNGSGCTSLDTGSLYDAVISAYGLPIRIGTSTTDIKEVYLGFTLADNPGGAMAFTPASVFGGISIDGSINFEAMEIYDIAFASGVSIPGSGVQQSYLGATASASFDSLAMTASFLLGKTCNLDVLKSLDPQVADFIETPGGVFNGVYARGSASIPIWNNGCLLTVGVSGDVGAWLLAGPPVTVGGLVGGGAWGKVACIAALRGQVTTLAQKSGDKFSFQGEGFGVAGAGFCEPEKWTSVPKSRDDGGCGTGDAQFKATFDNGWDIGAPTPSAIH